MSKLPEDYLFHINNADGFFSCAEYWIKKQRFDMACFNLHQAVVQALSGVMVSFMRYKPKTQFLLYLFREIADFDNEIPLVFKGAVTGENYLANVLDKCYMIMRVSHRTVVVQEDAEAAYIKAGALLELIVRKYGSEQ